ncbi:MAG: AraC family transcriptional regulator [Verrucomicrobiota bacterium]
MTSSSAIPCFREIPELYAAAGLDRAPRLPDFDAIALKTHSQRKAGENAIGPHRRGFYQFTYLLSDDRGRDVILAAAPDQVLSHSEYLRPTFEGQRGYTLLFKSTVLACQLASPTNEFPFFYLPASMELPVPSDVREKILPQLKAIEAAAGDPSPYRLQRLSALLAALLYEVRWIYEQAEVDTGAHRLCTQLACRFDEVVLQHFQTHHTVEDYARLLHVSADHLSAEIKAKTGRNARDIIAERLIGEAKHLLTYTELTVSQIADQLGFGEPTHFTRYFKRHLQEGPQEFRRRILHAPTEHVAPVPIDARRAAAV